MAKRGKSAVTICSTAFVTLGKAQARALGDADLPIAVIPHPFGLRSRDEVRDIASKCVDELAALATGGAR
ncbi:MAG TPA: hypothetical protein VM164_11935 [Burkholderiales bacterium]|nr:hypothetical protein [Burkholderiales bacterium]